MESGLQIDRLLGRFCWDGEGAVNEIFRINSHRCQILRSFESLVVCRMIDLDYCNLSMGFEKVSSAMTSSAKIMVFKVDAIAIARESDTLV